MGDVDELGKFIDERIDNFYRKEAGKLEIIIKYLDDHEEGLTAEDVYELKQMIIKGE